MDEESPVRGVGKALRDSIPDRMRSIDVCSPLTK
jgi:hypothetical protein